MKEENQGNSSNKENNDQNGKKTDPFKETQPKNNYQESDKNLDKGFGLPNQEPKQTQNIDNDSSLEDEVEVSMSDIEDEAEDNVARKKVKKLLNKYMPDLDPKKTEETEEDIGSIMEEADHLTLRFLNFKDITDMEQEERGKYEKAIVNRIKIFDKIKKFSFGLINPYQIQLSSRVKKAKSVKSKLGRSVRTLEDELNGKGYSSKGSRFYQELYDNLPQYIKEDQRLTTVMDDISKNIKSQNGKGGLKTLYRDLGEKGRIFKDVDDLTSSDIADYDAKIDQTKGKIDSINENKNKGSKKLIKKRMDLNSKYSDYLNERDKLYNFQDRVVDEMLGIKAEYDLTSQQIQLREATINGTKETLRDLNAGIKTLENFVKTKKDTVLIGGHMMDVQYAQKIAYQINVAGIPAGQAATHILKKMTEKMQQGVGGAVSEMGRKTIKSVNDKMKTFKRERVEDFKKELETAFYE